jgi:hypothetical protein
VLGEATPEPSESVEPGRAGEELAILAFVGADDELIVPLVLEDETGRWVPVVVASATPLAPAVRPEAGDDAWLRAGRSAAFARDVGGAGASDGSVTPIAPDDAAPAPARAARDETERWVPAFSFDSGVLVQDSDADVRSGMLMGAGAPSLINCFGDLNPDTDTVRCPASGSDLMVTPFVAGSVEVMTPALLAMPGLPRLFVHGGAAASFGFTRDVAKEGSPDTMEAAPGVAFLQEQAILGQGSETSAEVKPLLVTAGAGVAFTVDAWGRRFRIKPSFEYLREEIEVKGTVNRAVKINDPATSIADFRLIELRGSTRDYFHGIGPGLELEADAARTGPVMLTLFVAGKAYAFLGDLEMTTSDSDADGNTAHWRFEKNRWAFKGGVGLRFRWLPE